MGPNDVCSSGVPGWVNRKRVLLTAAHCGGGRYYNGTGAYIGDLYAIGDGLDVGMIAINGNGGGRFYDGAWSDGSGSSRRTYGAGRNNVGDLICLSGAQSGWKCDVEVRKVDVETTNDEGASQASSRRSRGAAPGWTNSRVRPR
ncbi:hypothetical protein [Kitasatospora sp. NPDC093558]|uniref:hypothetical protein n=1 Tax=Kitasatospora sp. NPDC093558 TaxID=3155201 RepID=UPI003414232F